MSIQLPILVIRDGQLEPTLEGAQRLAAECDGVLSYSKWWAGIERRYDRIPHQYREVTDRWRAYIRYVTSQLRAAKRSDR